MTKLAQDEKVTLILADRFTMRCPVCNGKNSAAAGGGKRCFHCEKCGFVECIWCSPVQPDWDTAGAALPLPEPRPETPREPEELALSLRPDTNWLPK